MARLGKREREAKRALIKANLNSPREATPYAMRSYLDTARMLGRTHVGFRNPQNAKGSDGGRTTAARFGEQPRRVDAIRGPVAQQHWHDRNRHKAQLMELRKANDK